MVKRHEKSCSQMSRLYVGCLSMAIKWNSVCPTVNYVGLGNIWQ